MGLLVGMNACPGSSRAAFASMVLACGLADNTVMEAADWASACTLYAIYVCLFPGDSVLSEFSSGQQVLVQDPL